MISDLKYNYHFVVTIRTSYVRNIDKSTSQ